MSSIPLLWDIRGTLTQDENPVENNVCLRPMSIPRQTEGMAVHTSPLHRCQACHYFANGWGTLRFVTFRTLPRGFRHSESHGTRQWVLGQGLSVTVTLTWTCVPTQAADRSILTSLGGTAGHHHLETRVIFCLCSFLLGLLHMTAGQYVELGKLYRSLCISFQDGSGGAKCLL